MKQYLLAVHLVEGEPEPPEEQVQRAYKAVDAFNAEVQSAGLDLDGYHLFHATRADLLRRLGRRRDARAAYDAAIARAANRAERSFLARQRDSL